MLLPPRGDPDALPNRPASLSLCTTCIGIPTKHSLLMPNNHSESTDESDNSGHNDQQWHVVRLQRSPIPLIGPKLVFSLRRPVKVVRVNRRWVRFFRPPCPFSGVACDAFLRDFKSASQARPLNGTAGTSLHNHRPRRLLHFRWLRFITFRDRVPA